MANLDRRELENIIINKSRARKIRSNFSTFTHSHSPILTRQHSVCCRNKSLKAPRASPRTRLFHDCMRSLDLQEAPQLIFFEHFKFSFYSSLLRLCNQQRRKLLRGRKCRTTHKVGLQSTSRMPNAEILTHLRQRFGAA